jgi:hypothetical protein
VGWVTFFLDFSPDVSRLAIGAWRAYRGLRLCDGLCEGDLFFKKMTLGSLSCVNGDFACLA